MFTVNKDAVNVTIGNILFGSDDDASTGTREKVLAIFVMFEDAADPADGAEYIDADQDRNSQAEKVAIKFARCFDLVLPTWQLTCLFEWHLASQPTCRMYRR